MVQAAWPPVTSRGRALLTSRPVRLPGIQLVGDAREARARTAPARLADPRVQVLHPVETARGAALGRKHPQPALPGKATALGEAAFEDRPRLPGDGQLQRLAGPGLLDPERHRVHVYLRPAQPQNLVAAHAGVEAETEGVARDVVAHGGLDAPVQQGSTSVRRVRWRWDRPPVARHWSTGSCRPSISMHRRR